MPRTRRIDDDTILAAARDVIARHGPCIAVADIARAAGVSEALLYQRFGSRDQLFVMALAPLPVRVDAIIGPHARFLAIETPVGASLYLEEVVGGLVRLLRATSYLLWPTLAIPPADVERRQAWRDALPTTRVMTELTWRLRFLRERGLIADHHPQTLAYLLLATAQGIVLDDDPAADTQQHIRRTAAMLWEGVRPPLSS